MGGFVTIEGILSVQTINVCTPDYIISFSVVILGHKSRLGAFFFFQRTITNLCTHTFVWREKGDSVVLKGLFGQIAVKWGIVAQMKVWFGPNGGEVWPQGEFGPS